MNTDRYDNLYDLSRDDLITMIDALETVLGTIAQRVTPVIVGEDSDVYGAIEDIWYALDLEDPR